MCTYKFHSVCALEWIFWLSVESWRSETKGPVMFYILIFRGLDLYRRFWACALQLLLYCIIKNGMGPQPERGRTDCRLHLHCCLTTSWIDCFRDRTIINNTQGCIRCVSRSIGSTLVSDTKSSIIFCCFNFNSNSGIVGYI